MAITTGIQSGTVIRVYVEGTPVAKATDSSIEFSRGEVSISHKDVTSSWKEVDAGELSCSISTNALYATDDGESFATLWTNYAAKTAVVVKFGNAVVDDSYYTGSFYITSLSINAANNESVTYSVSFTNNGAISQAVNS